MNIVITFIYGIAIALLGVIGYFATGQVSKTALIPCVFGFPVMALAIAAWLKPSLTRQTAIASGIIAFLALGGTMRGLIGLVDLISGGEVARPSAIITQAIMAIASMAYVLYIVVSLRRRKNQQ